jgi:hypothetical protein
MRSSSDQLRLSVTGQRGSPEFCTLAARHSIEIIMLRQSLQFSASLFAVNLLLACSSHSPDTSSDKSATSAQKPAAEARTPAPTVIDDQLKALDKAKAAREAVEKAQVDRNKEIDDESGG